ncbi:MAG: hypothetical protein V1492_01955 [Candidatus Micrarchaeota archaeon]
MMIVDVCQASFLNGFLYGPVLQITGTATFFAVIVFVLVYYFATVTNNPKMLAWVKTEVVQVVISIMSIALLFTCINFFCGINVDSVRELVDQPPTGAANIFEEGHNYLINAVSYSHNTVRVVRYFASAYTILSHRNQFHCDLWCVFGFSGTISSSLANYGGRMGTMNMLFGTTIFYLMSALNSLFIFLFAVRGFIIFFLPAAIIVRSLPYLRPLGSLLIAVCLSFFIVYPLLLSMFSIVSSGADIFHDPGIHKPGDAGLFVEYAAKEKDKFQEVSGMSEFGYGSVFGALGTSVYTDDTRLVNDFFDNEPRDFFDVLELTARSFVGAFLLPSLALAGAIASVRFFARMYGEEIDLSKLSQMV